jgi:hypothetical protein
MGERDYKANNKILLKIINQVNKVIIQVNKVTHTLSNINNFKDPVPVYYSL